MKRHGLILSAAFILIILIAPYGASAAEEGTGPSVVVVTIEGSAFSPEVAVVKAGTEVVWKNKDSSPHTVTADDGSFSSGSLSQGEEFRRKFTTPGTFTYSCEVHAYMSGKVEVK
jgi:plastocyanin